MEAEEVKEMVKKISDFTLSENVALPVILDLQGSKWRLGKLDPIELKEGEVVELALSEESDFRGRLPVPHEDFFRAAASSEKEIVLNDAKVLLETEEVTPALIKACVKKGGPVSSRKGITFLGSAFRSESLKKKDRELINMTESCQNIRYAVSYIKDMEEMKKYRELIGRDAYIIAKLERSEAVKDAMKLQDYADEIWLCRGDLGAELGLRKMAEAAAGFSELLKELKRPVVLAGQVLEHMASFPEPTRSEVSCIYEALRKGYSGVVLSDETAVGRYPVEACRMAAMFLG
jgi:pyruvate kinase